jgi:hypothetical protein
MKKIQLAFRITSDTDNIKGLIQIRHSKSQILFLRFVILSAWLISFYSLNSKKGDYHIVSIRDYSFLRPPLLVDD